MPMSFTWPEPIYSRTLEKQKKKKKKKKKKTTKKTNKQKKKQTNTKPLITRITWI